MSTLTATLSKLSALLDSREVRNDVYRKVRRAFKGVAALCAATVSEYLIRAAVLHGYRPWTAQLERALSEKGWVEVGQAAVPVQDSDSPTGQAGPPVLLLQPFDICYSVDSNDNGAPDHVFIFLRWLDEARQIAEVIDNYSAHPHPRNLGAPQWYKGKRLAYGRFDHAQRVQEGQAKIGTYATH